MKKMINGLAAILLAASTSAFAAPTFIPMGNVVTSVNNSYDLAYSSFQGVKYNADLPGYVPPSTKAPYGVYASTSIQVPQIGDVNTVTYKGTKYGTGCTFQFVYQGNGKFQVSSLTSTCSVQTSVNGTDLILQ